MVPNTDHAAATDR
jgi:hypothetical protein